MKITDWTKKLAAGLVAGGLMIPMAVDAASLDTNLLVDPGFEDVGTTAGAYGALPLNSWMGGSMGGFTYASGQYDLGGPLAGGGERYFTSNQTAGGGDAEAPGDVAQSVDVSTGDTASAISAGLATYSLSAFFTTYSTNEDFGTLQVDFLDAGDASLGSDAIGPTGNEGGWTLHSGGGMVPVGTSSVLVSVYGTPVNGGPDGYIDNTSFSISLIPEPSSMMLVGLGMAGSGILVRRRWRQ